MHAPTAHRLGLAALVVSLTTCASPLDREDVATWANTGSALGVYTNLHVPVAFAVGEHSFADPSCPVTSDDGTTVRIIGGCTDSEGEQWTGEVRLTRVGGPRELDLEFDAFGNGSDPAFLTETTGSASIRSLDGDAYSFQVDIVREGGITTEIEYMGTVVGDYDQPTTWNGSGLVDRQGLASPTGRAEVSTVDQVVDDTLCSNAAASGQTTILAGGHEIVVTYDGETDCDDDQAAKVSVDGEDEGLVTGVSCAIASSTGGPGGSLLLLALLGLTRRRSCATRAARGSSRSRRSARARSCPRSARTRG